MPGTPRPRRDRSLGRFPACFGASAPLDFIARLCALIPPHGSMFCTIAEFSAEAAPTRFKVTALTLPEAELHRCEEADHGPVDCGALSYSYGSGVGGGSGRKSPEENFCAQRLSGRQGLGRSSRIHWASCG